MKSSVPSPSLTYQPQSLMISSTNVALPRPRPGASLLPYLLTPYPSPLHLSYLSHALKSSTPHPALLTPSALLSHLLSPLTPSLSIPIPTHILSLLLSSLPLYPTSPPLSLNQVHLELLFSQTLRPFPQPPAPELLSLLGLLLVEKAKEGGPIDSGLLSEVLGELLDDLREEAIGLKGVLIGLGVVLPGLQEAGARGGEEMERLEGMEGMGIDIEETFGIVEGGHRGLEGVTERVDGQGGTHGLGEVVLLSLVNLSSFIPPVC
jgi:hypothetical protein